LPCDHKFENNKVITFQQWLNFAVAEVEVVVARVEQVVVAEDEATSTEILAAARD
jgi:hypothetical protein